MATKPHMNRVFIGHVDHGKATTVGAGTKEPVLPRRTLGVNQLIIAINKMDATKPAFNEARYNEVKGEVTGLLKAVGYKTDTIPFIPLSAYKGENVVKGSTNLGWWKGKSLTGTFDDFSVPEKPVDKPLRLPIQDVYSITGIGVVPVGRIETGILKPHIKVHFQPADKVGAN